MSRKVRNVERREHGRALMADREEAAEWYREAAEQGHASAAFLLGLLLETGDGVDKDEIEGWLDAIFVLLK